MLSAICQFQLHKYTIIIEERGGRVKVISCYHRLTAFLRTQPVAKRAKQRCGTRKIKQQQLLCEGWTYFFNLSTAWDAAVLTVFEYYESLAGWVIPGVTVGGLRDKQNIICIKFMEPPAQSSNIKECPYFLLQFLVPTLSRWIFFSSDSHRLGLSSQQWGLAAQAGGRPSCWLHTTPSHLSWAGICRG